jgi:copper chaperone
MQTVTLGISGMSCGGCVRSVSKILSELDGVVKAEVSLEAKRAVVEFDPGKLGVDHLKRAIEDAGYEITP